MSGDAAAVPLGHCRASAARMIRHLAELDMEHGWHDRAASFRALADEVERGPVVVQTSVRVDGVSAELAADAVGPAPPRARRVFVASPYAGDIAANEAYARAAMVDSLGRGEAPFVPHLLYTQVLPEDGGAGRQRGLDAALAMLAGCELLAAYEDRGVSAGMVGEIKHAQTLGIQVEWRLIGEVPRG